MLPSNGLIVRGYVLFQRKAVRQAGRQAETVRQTDRQTDRKKERKKERTKERKKILALFVCHGLKILLPYEEMLSGVCVSELSAQLQYH